jgi:hypothetical protein
MKEILKFIVLIGVVGLALYACINTEPNDDKVYESTSDVVRYKIKGCPKRSMSVIHFEYNGHTYLMFGDNTIVHDPDCACHNHSNEYIEY